MNKKKLSTRSMAGCAMLSAIAFVLMFLDFPLTFPFVLMPSFIKFDFSDLPALIGAYVYGPAFGVLVELIKNLVHLLITKTAGIGELSNFILGAVFAFCAGKIYAIKKTKKNAIIGGIIGSILMGLISIPTNYFVVYPAYYTFMPKEAILSMYQVILPSVDSILECLTVFNFPFTAVKGLVCVAISVPLYKPLRKVLKHDGE